MAGNPFDALQAAVVASVNNAFGYDAAWSPSNGSPQLTARVLFREPTEAEKLGPMNLAPETYYVEWYLDSFPGLYEAVRAGMRERLSLNQQEYWVVAAHRKHDGKTFSAYLEKANFV